MTDNLKCLIRFFVRFMRQPSYVVNAWRYVELAFSVKRDRLWPRRDVTRPRTEKFKSLLIVLRTSDFVQHCSPASRGLEEYGIYNKRDVIKCCGATFVEATRAFRDRYGSDALRIVLVEDRLSEEGRAAYQDAAPFEEVSSAPGNRETFLAQIEIARQADEDTLVCILEDDYLLKPTVFCDVFDLFNATSIDGFTPHFHPAYCNRGVKTDLFFIGGKFYAHVPTTTCTFFISARDIRRNLTRLRRYYGCEIGCINEIWRNAVCLSPCCSTLAEHMHKSDLTYVFSGLSSKNRSVI